MNISMTCVCGATATARAKRDTWRFGHAHRFCGIDELAARRRKEPALGPPAPRIHRIDELAARRRRRRAKRAGTSSPRPTTDR